MMKTIKILCLVAVINMIGTIAVIADQNQIASDINNPDYYTLVNKLKNNDLSIDFMALRLSYTKTKDYMPYGADESAKDSAFAALNKKNYTEVINHAKSILDKNYVDLKAHMLCRIAYREIGNKEKYNFHNTVLQGLINSLYSSGDGTTPEKAILVISVPEEYFLLNANGLKRIKNSMFTDNGHNYDKMDVEDIKTAEKMIIYFNIDIPYGWLSKSLKK